MKSADELIQRFEATEQPKHQQCRQVDCRDEQLEPGVQSCVLLRPPIPNSVINIQKFIWNLRLQTAQIEKFSERIQEIISDQCAENEPGDHTLYQCERIIDYPEKVCLVSGWRNPDRI